MKSPMLNYTGRKQLWTTKGFYVCFTSIHERSWFQKCNSWGIFHLSMTADSAQIDRNLAILLKYVVDSLLQFWNIHQYGFSNLQNTSVKFLQHAKISLAMQKISESYLMIFFPIPLEIKVCIKKWVYPKMTKNFRLQNFFTSCKNFCMKLQKPLFEA